MTVQIIRGDARSLPLADDSVDLVVTSPPYFGLRSYQDGGQHYDGQIGDEPTPAEFVDALLDVTRECVRVLKPSGSMWVNLGDKYSTGNSGESGMAKLGEQYRGGGHTQAKAKTRIAAVDGMRPKSLIGIPWRYALLCIDDLGLILRAEVIWSKPNGLPESVTDRVRRSHEQWFHFTLQPRYFSAVDEIREQYAPGDPSRSTLGRSRREQREVGVATISGGDADWSTGNPLGKLPGSVWTVPTQPLTVPAHLGVDHFAAFPMEWPRRIIRGWSPSGVCVECGEGRRPVVDRERTQTRRGVDSIRGANDGSVIAMSGGSGFGQRAETTATITGYACACPVVECATCAASGYAITPDGRTIGACGTCDGDGYRSLPPTRPAVVLDPFSGTGTTALVASALGRHGISVDMSADYCRLAQWRTTDPGERARAAEVQKPPAQVSGQLGMFDDEDAAEPLDFGGDAA